MEFKEYQLGVLRKFDRFLSVLSEQVEKIEKIRTVIKESGMDPASVLSDPCTAAWDQLNNERRLPTLLDQDGNEVIAPYLVRKDGFGKSIPNICIKMPTGGGKTLLAASSVERLQTDFLKNQTGFVLWVVPTDAIYRQTWKQLANREHPYRQILERASGGRVKLLEKADSFNIRDTAEFLCVMLLMLPSASRQTKETLRLFRDGGRFTSFFPEEDDSVANAELLKAVPNLDENDLADLGWKDGIVPGTRSIKMSLGNVLRLLRPVIILDEGHKAYSDTARNTIDGFNPKFLLELSATPNTNGRHSSNVLVSVPGTDLKDEEMIKLPVNVINAGKGGWKGTLVSAHDKLSELRKEAEELHTAENRYIRPILLIRVERTGKDQRDSGLVHAEDAREYLIQKLGVKEEEIRLKTSEDDELGDEDMMHQTCKVRYIITKAALQEGWDCPFAYVLAILSKTTANTALTQMIGRVLRQPGARLTRRPGLDECFVFTFDQEVNKAVQSVRAGLQDEGLGDLASSVRGIIGGGKGRTTKPLEIKRREGFRKIPPILLPRILHKEKKDFRLLDYERDILGALDWKEFHCMKATAFENEKAKIERTIATVTVVKKPDGGQMILDNILQEETSELPAEGLDIPFLVRQLLEVIPNPWEATRILKEAIARLTTQGLDTRRLYANRLTLLQLLKEELRDQVNVAAESLFRTKLEKGEIQFRLDAAKSSELNWRLAQSLEIDISEEDRELSRKNGSPLEKSLFEKVFERELNSLEKDTAWYLDGEACVHWWHRIAVGQDSYGLQGWQKNRVFPDFLVCITGTEDGKFRFSILETKGDHLKGNDDTEYKRKFLDLLTCHSETAIRAGEFVLGKDAEGMKFRMLLQKSWQTEIGDALWKATDPT